MPHHSVLRCGFSNPFPSAILSEVRFGHFCHSFRFTFQHRLSDPNSYLRTSLGFAAQLPGQAYSWDEWGAPMTRQISAAWFLIFACLFLTSCSGAPGGGCISNCGGGNATISFVLTATPPNPSLGLSIQTLATTITGISLVPTTGNTVNIPLNASSFIADLNRATSDSILLATAVSVPSGNYAQVTVTFSASRVTSCTQANPGVPGCAAGTLGSVTGAVGSATISTNLSLGTNQQSGIVLNANIGDALTLNGQIVTAVNLGSANVFSVIALPPSSTQTDLASGELAHVDDVMGLVTAVSGSTLTIQTSTRGSITATANSSTQYSSVNCSSQNFSCVQGNAVAIIDTLLNADGTFTLTFYQPLTTPSLDVLEGVVTGVPNSVTNQFAIVVTDSVFSNSGSVLRGQVNLGDQVVVTLNAPNPFTIVSKGLTYPAGSDFEHSTSVASILPGQTVAFPASTFTAQSGGTPGTATSQDLALRLTRFSAVMSSPTLPVFSANTFPPFFGLTTAQQFQTTSARLSVDGISSLTNIPAGTTISTAALYIGPPVAPQFAAQSVRAH